MFSSLSLLLYSPCTMNLRGCCDTKPASSTLSQSIHDRSMYESRLLCAYELGQHLCARRPTLPAQGRASVSLRAHDLRWQASSCVNDGSLLFAPTKALVGHTERGLEIRRLRADSPQRLLVLREAAGLPQRLLRRRSAQRSPRAASSPTATPGSAVASPASGTGAHSRRGPPGTTCWHRRSSSSRCRPTRTR